MSSEVVKYHNDFNRIRLPSFTEQEQNLLCGILAKMRDKGSGNVIKFTTDELRRYCTQNYTNKELGEVLSVLKEKFFKADFTILIEDKERDLIGKETINLFNSFILWYPKDDTNHKNLQKVEMVANPRFAYILNELEKNFTGFKLEEFVSLSGKYTKTLYRLLKQFRKTGKLYMQWEEFARVMDIPEEYNQSNIDTWILKPAIKELSKERNIFDQIRVPFKNLKYEKEKQKGTRGRGGKVIGITFSFKPEVDDEKEAKIEELEEANKALEQKLQISQTREQQTNQKYASLIGQLNLQQEFGNYIGISFYNEQGEIIKIKDMWKSYNELRVRFENRENSKTYTKDFESEKHLDNYLNKFARL